MHAKPPSIMVSSTYYDLKQIRADIHDFIVDQLGYQALVSELPSFPIDPDAATIENCKIRVEKDADIMILVIGCRYGSIDEATNKSITNLEYLAARAKGIPIYVFVERQLSNILPVWRNNKSANFSPVVDDSRVIEFVDEIRSKHKIWVQDFDGAKDLIRALRVQLAYLANDSLNLRKRLVSELVPIGSKISGKSFRYVLERPPAWEYLLFAQVMEDDIQKYADLKREYGYGIALGLGEYVEDSRFSSWAQTRLAELARFTRAIESLVNVALPKAFGPEGTPGDPDEIVFVAQKLGEVYKESINWTQHIRRTKQVEDFDSARLELERFSESLISKLESFGSELTAKIRDQLSRPLGERTPISISLTLELSNVDAFNSAINLLVTRINSK
jgi:hypothetical protein